MEMATAGDGTLLVRWERHQAELVGRLRGYLAGDAFVDVTLWCQGRRFSAHRLVLSACCHYFEQVLADQKGCRGAVSVLLRGLDPEAVSALLELMYRGEARVAAALLPHLLHAARELGVRLPPSELHQEQCFKVSSPDDSVRSSVKKTDSVTPPVSTAQSPQVPEDVSQDRLAASGEHWPPEDSPRRQHGWSSCLRGAAPPPQDSVVRKAGVECGQSARAPAAPTGIRQQPQNCSVLTFDSSPSVVSLPAAEEPSRESQHSDKTLWALKKMQDTEDETQFLQYQSQNNANNNQNNIEQQVVKQQGQQKTQADCNTACTSPHSFQQCKPGDAGQKRFACAECGRAFSQRRNLQYHLSLHSGSREFAADCPQCGKTVSNRSYLRSHMKIHRNQREYACAECGRRFNQSVAYRNHVRLHAGHRPHRCAACGRAFSRRSLLTLHQRTHTGEKPFSCQVCGKQFSDRSNLVVHARSHSGVKPYSCDVCGRAYSRRAGLVSHMLSAHLKGKGAGAAAGAADQPGSARSQRCSVITSTAT